MFTKRLHEPGPFFVILAACTLAQAQQLQSVFPAGAEVGTSASVVFSGNGLDNVSGVRCSHPGVTFQRGDGNTFVSRVAEGTPPGLYDVQTIGSSGLSSTRAFFVSKRTHIVEQEPAAPGGPGQAVPLGCVISGRITKGDVDEYRFKAAKGDKLVVECWADRIDSSLRGILELRDAGGKRLAVSRGFFGVDPVVTYAIPVDGEYLVRLHDLVYAGGDSHFYRLDISTGPRVLFAIPPVVQRGSETLVTLFGWNLHSEPELEKTLSAAGLPSGCTEGSPAVNTLAPVQPGEPLPFESATVHLTGSEVHQFPPARRQPPEHAVDSFPHYYPGADVPIAVGLTDVPVVLGRENSSPDTPFPLAIPSEAAGQLTRSDERHWYSMDVRRGEVLYIEAFGERIGSPVDLDVSIFDSAGIVELASFHDDVVNIGGLRFPSAHLDPEGRWVAPADGRYLIVIRNLISGIADDSRRVYRLSVRREEPDVQLVALAEPASPAGINVQRGGRTVVDILAFRRRGLNGPVRISARNLPPGVTCPDIWLGPDVSRAPLVLTADEDAEQLVTTLDLVGHVDGAIADSVRPVQSGTMIRGGLPGGSGRLMAELPMAISGEAPVRITANGHEPRDHHLYGELAVHYAPGEVIDVAVHVQRRESGHAAAVKLTGVGLPELIANQMATIPAGEDKGYISFYLPHSLPVGTYTFAVRAETTVPIPGQDKTQTVTVHSNAVTFEVHPPAFRLELDLSVPAKIKRGEIAQINYTTRRLNGFIGKIHTELAAPGKVTDVGRLRGRGVTSVGQTESGTIQVVANEDAELGLQPFLRLYAVGVLEDQPVYHGSCFLNLEIVE